MRLLYHEKKLRSKKIGGILPIKSFFIFLRQYAGYFVGRFRDKNGQDGGRGQAEERKATGGSNKKILENSDGKFKCKHLHFPEECDIIKQMERRLVREFYDVRAAMRILS